MAKNRFPLFTEEDYGAGLKGGRFGESLKAFQELNAKRLQFLMEVARRRQKDFLEVLPMLLQFNHPLLPGWCGNHVPSGIARYIPTSEQQKAARRLAKTLDVDRTTKAKADILGLYLIGSSGTIAQNERSDLDIWIVHDESLSVIARKLLAEKVKKIEEWANENHCDAHFFLMTPDYFRSEKGQIDNLENCGSAQHYLLLDEFYRTGLLLAGRYPLWWIIPPEEEKNYRELSETIATKRHLVAQEAIDFGDIPTIPAEEFLGASLWQMQKAIQSPYKSVLKISLMEYYASQFPSSTPLCHQFKRQIIGAIDDPSRLDPYLMIYYCVERYLQSINATQRLDLVRRCLYVKIGVPLSRPSKVKSWRIKVVENLTHSWSWPDGKFQYLDDIKNWKALDVMQERQALMNELNYCYQFLSKFAVKNKAIAHISYDDLTLLGRKLFASFERKPGKIEYINPGITADLSEEKLSFQYVDNKLGNHYWALYVFREGNQKVFLKKCAFLEELVVWVVVNGVYQKHSQVQVLPGTSTMRLPILEDFLTYVYREFASSSNDDSAEHFRHLSALKACLFTVNLEAVSTAEEDVSNTKIVSSVADPLRYGKSRGSLVRSVNLITISTWGEVYVSQFVGKTCLYEAVIKCLNQVFQSRKNIKHFQVWCPPSHFSEAITRRSRQLVGDLFEHFCQIENFGDGRYILKGARGYNVIEKGESELEVKAIGTEKKLYNHLSEPLKKFSPIRFDEHAQAPTIIQYVCSRSAADVIQLYYHTDSDDRMLSIFILDERGALFTCVQKSHNIRVTVLHYLHFLERIYYKKSAQEAALGPLIEIKELSQRVDGNWESIEVDGLLGVVPEKSYFVQAISTGGQGTGKHYDFYCEGLEFKHSEYHDDIYRVVRRFVLDNRRQGTSTKNYPIYLSDLEISGQSEHDLSIGDYLRQKRQIEHRLNADLARVST